MKKIIILILLISSCTNDSIRKSYHSNGEIKEEFEVNNDGEKHGKYMLYYKNGQIKEITAYQNGLAHGKSVDYYPNGIVELIATFKNGMLDGKQKLYRKNGSLEMVQLYKEDTVLIDKRYYPNGKVKLLDSRIIFQGENYLNTLVKFDENGNDTEASQYAEWRIVDNNLQIDLSRGFINDSVKVKIVKDFRSMEKIREIMFVQTDQLKVILEPGDFHKNRLNIAITYYNPELITIINGSKVKFESHWSKDYYIQMDKGESPKQYNLDAIW